MDPFEDEVARRLAEDPNVPGVRVRELLEPLGCAAGKTVVDDYLEFHRVRGHLSGASTDAPGRMFSDGSRAWAKQQAADDGERDDGISSAEREELLSAPRENRPRSAG